MARYLIDVNLPYYFSIWRGPDFLHLRDLNDEWSDTQVWIYAQQEGDGAAAERIFLDVRDGFLAQGNGYDAAMVAIEDLAFLYLREGRAADMKRLAEEIHPIFQAQDVHREAIAALMLFQEAARREELTEKALREYVSYLRDARSDPSLRFQQERPS